jgi:hypothetical protein
MLKKFTRNVTNARNIAVNAMRNIQAPAYCPVVFGVKADDQRGVVVEVKKTMSIDSPLSAIEVDVAIDNVELAVDVAMSMSIMVGGNMC